jgi:hypothetical protein
VIALLRVYEGYTVPFKIRCVMVLSIYLLVHEFFPLRRLYPPCDDDITTPN